MDGSTDRDGVIIPPRREGHRDTNTLQEAIRAEIRRKQAAGDHIDVDLAREVELELRDLATRSGIPLELADRLLVDGDAWNIDPDYRISSHRNGPSFLIIWCKKLLRPFVRLYTDFLVNRQAQLNLYHFRAIRVLVRDLALLRRDQLDQRHKLAALEREIHRLRERLRQEGIRLEPEPLPGEPGHPGDGGS
jgi:hypothetical protein